LAGIRSLVQAAALFAKAGDCLRALTLLQGAQARLNADVVRHPSASLEASATLAQIDDLVSAVDTIAHASM
jgi:hypothetical protein